MHRLDTLHSPENLGGVSLCFISFESRIIFRLFETAKFFNILLKVCLLASYLSLCVRELSAYLLSDNGDTLESQGSLIVHAVIQNIKNNRKVALLEA